MDRYQYLQGELTNEDLQAAFTQLTELQEKYPSEHPLSQAVDKYTEIIGYYLRKNLYPRELKAFQKKITEQHEVILKELAQTSASHLVENPPPFELRKPTVTFDLSNTAPSLFTEFAVIGETNEPGAVTNSKRKIGIHLPIKLFDDQSTITYSLWPGEYEGRLTVKGVTSQDEANIVLFDDDNPLKQITGAETFEVEEDTELVLQPDAHRVLIKPFGATEGLGHLGIWAATNEGRNASHLLSIPIRNEPMPLNLPSGVYFLCYNFGVNRPSIYLQQIVVDGEESIEVELPLGQLNTPVATELPGNDHILIINIDRKTMPKALQKHFLQSSIEVYIPPNGHLAMPVGQYELSISLGNLGNTLGKQECIISAGKTTDFNIDCGFFTWSAESGHDVSISHGSIDIDPGQGVYKMEFRFYNLDEPDRYTNGYFKKPDWLLTTMDENRDGKWMRWVIRPGKYRVEIYNLNEARVEESFDIELAMGEEVVLDRLFTMIDFMPKRGVLDIDFTNELGLFPDEINLRLIKKESEASSQKSGNQIYLEPQEAPVTLELSPGLQAVVWKITSNNYALLDILDIEPAQHQSYQLPFAQVSVSIPNLPDGSFQKAFKFNLRPLEMKFDRDQPSAPTRKIVDIEAKSTEVLVPAGKYSTWLTFLGREIGERSSITLSEGAVLPIDIEPAFIEWDLPPSPPYSANGSWGEIKLSVPKKKRGFTYHHLKLYRNIDGKMPPCERTYEFEDSNHGARKIIIALDPGEYELRDEDKVRIPLNIEEGQTIYLQDIEAFTAYLETLKQ
ncbi:hypothetical protein [Cerasicoccus frondis]|uniref:hypothetical protein n=1 Tax=Cerasicoccus frondis TaxID=490090 RepID=UPI0028524F79|nr:hypothetical protein [Cerasicoccus frondis]